MRALNWPFRPLKISLKNLRDQIKLTEEQNAVVFTFQLEVRNCAKDVIRVDTRLCDKLCFERRRLSPLRQGSLFLLLFIVVRIGIFTCNVGQLLIGFFRFLRRRCRLWSSELARGLVGLGLLHWFDFMCRALGLASCSDNARWTSNRFHFANRL